MIGNFIRSIKKGRRLASYQRKYATLYEKSLTKSIQDNIRDALSNDANDEKKLRAEYVEFCLSDPAINEIGKTYGITTADFEQMYFVLSFANGLNQYYKGHYAVLSTLAYPEPLEFAVVKLRDEANSSEIAEALVKYWSGELPTGSLSRAIADSKNFVRRD